MVYIYQIRVIGCQRYIDHHTDTYDNGLDEQLSGITAVLVPFVRGCHSLGLAEARPQANYWTHT